MTTDATTATAEPTNEPSATESTNGALDVLREMREKTREAVDAMAAGKSECREIFRCAMEGRPFDYHRIPEIIKAAGIAPDEFEAKLAMITKLKEDEKAYDERADELDAQLVETRRLFYSIRETVGRFNAEIAVKQNELNYRYTIDSVDKSNFQDMGIALKRLKKEVAEMINGPEAAPQLLPMNY